jgi:hypothetical protein
MTSSEVSTEPAAGIASKGGKGGLPAKDDGKGTVKKAAGGKAGGASNVNAPLDAAGLVAAVEVYRERVAESARAAVSDALAALDASFVAVEAEVLASSCARSS